MDEQTKQKRKISWVVIYIAVLLAIIITFRCFLMIGRVPSESMEPTLMVHTGSSETVMHMRKKNHNAAILSCFIRKMK